MKEIRVDQPVKIFVRKYLDSELLLSNKADSNACVEGVIVAKSQQFCWIGTNAPISGFFIDMEQLKLYLKGYMIGKIDSNKKYLRFVNHLDIDYFFSFVDSDTKCRK
jgi:hypothetical protein